MSVIDGRSGSKKDRFPLQFGNHNVESRDQTDEIWSFTVMLYGNSILLWDTSATAGPAAHFGTKEQI
jgi:hypothetical protein